MMNYKNDLKWAEEMERQMEIERMQRELNDLKKLNTNFWDALADRINPFRLYTKKQQAAAEDLLNYRKKLLVTKKDREKKGIILGKTGQGEPSSNQDNKKLDLPPMGRKAK